MNFIKQLTSPKAKREPEEIDLEKIEDELQRVIAECEKSNLGKE